MPNQNDIYYETPIQQLQPTTKHKEDRERDWWERITALKADAVWRAIDGWHLAEVEEELNMEGIGQALCYRELWNQLNPDSKIIKAWIITAGDDPRLHPGLAAAGLHHYLVNVLP